MAVNKKNELYKCNVCGNIVTLLHVGSGDLVCCNQPMKLLDEKTQDQGNEKHIPVITKKGNKIHVKVGSIKHPMEESHYIQWIEIIANGKRYIKYLNPGEKPEATFEIEAESIIAREYCNLHGLWKA